MTTDLAAQMIAAARRVAKPATPQDLWGYATGGVGASVSAAGAGFQAAIGRFQELIGAEGPDFVAEGLLDGSSEGEERARLLHELHAAGVPLEELRRAVEHDRLALVPLEGVLRGDGEHSLRQLADEAGVEEDRLARRFSALGFLRADASSRLNHDALGAARALRELEEAGLPEANIEEICRLSGTQVSSIARGVREVFRQSFVDPDASERELGLRYAAAARRLLPVIKPLLHFSLTMSLLDLVRSDMVSHAERIHGSVPGGRQVAVCFADLAGFTRLSETRSPDELQAVVERFEALVREYAPMPARHIKLIGDGVVIVTDTVPVALGAAQRLVRTADAIDGFPRIHAGVASGVAITSGGDWYGQPVNLASRLAECAPPGEIYVTEEVREQAPATFEGAGRRLLDGIDEAVTVFTLPARTENPGGNTGGGGPGSGESFMSQAAADAASAQAFAEADVDVERELLGSRSALDDCPHAGE